MLSCIHIDAWMLVYSHLVATVAKAKSVFFCFSTEEMTSAVWVCERIFFFSAGSHCRNSYITTGAIANYNVSPQVSKPTSTWITKWLPFDFIRTIKTMLMNPFILTSLSFFTRSKFSWVLCFFWFWFVFLSWEVNTQRLYMNISNSDPKKVFGSASAKWKIAIAMAITTLWQ